MNDRIGPFSTKLNKRQKLIWLLMPFWVIGFIFLHIEDQASEKRTAFLKEVQDIRQNYLIEEQKISSLIEAIAQQYSGQYIKSSHDISIFAQGLLNDYPYIEAMGLATYAKKTQLPSFEEKQKRLGFESFKIRPKGIFLQEKENASAYFLAINQVEPLTPDNASYIAEDLFSIPEIEKRFDNQVKENSTAIFWLEQTHPNKSLAVVTHPVYATEPTNIPQEDRSEWVTGAIVFLVNTHSALTKPIQKAFRDDAVEVSFRRISDNYNTGWSWHSANMDNPPPSYWKRFETVLVPSLSCYNCRITITNHLDWQEIDKQKAVIFGLISALIFILLSIATLSILNKTRILSEMHNRLQELLDSSQDAIIITDKFGIIKVWNPYAEELFGYTQREALQNSLVQLLFDRYTIKTVFGDSGTLMDLFVTTSEDGHQNTKASKLEMSLLTRSGEKILAEISYSVLMINDEPEISLFIKDITNQRKTEKEIRQYAFYDSLTQLENRVYFKSQIEEQLAERPEQSFAILFMDLDGFKQVNDSLGHNIGDELLKVIAKRLTHNIKGVGDQSHICRFGGDEFVLMLRDADIYNISSIALRILNNIERTIKIDNHDLRVSASIGIAFYPQNGQSVDALLRHADTAMYEAKAQGKNTFAIYQEQMSQHVSARLQMEKHLRNALSNNEMYLCYQPKMEITTGKIIGVEALLRWRNPELGLVPPNVFIPIAEETRIILPISHWVVDQTVKQLKSWRNTPFQDLSIAINISSSQFSAEGFIANLATKMEQADVPNRLLEIELTESTVMTNADTNIKLLRELRKLGFELAVDDFGTGYSSLSYLKRFPLSILKIDKSFIDGLPMDEEDISISEAILHLAHNLNVRVVAEGVETLKQLNFLEERQCEYIQGFVISKPLKSDELEVWLTEHADNFYQSATYRALRN
ncbi:EAL domain-containing protein [Thiomicrorhabdus sp. 6S3-12]|uniref:bifunctional diguanylate cyclase/phosphodiesterase n=1 Tax=Thiomicrorhabdus sp. 6S3-12 TaxID=2819681 RepID=UPI001AADF1BC|nr:EAL domain-containing protein [Thiomicrorhabdus sp. 6S3-12]MBO1925098.1 EAL domain-containing protein [Thiomicrorhabdus sp. 6S3-12]